MTSSIFNFKRIPRIVRRAGTPRAFLAGLAGVVLIELLISLHPRPGHKDLLRHRFYNPNVTPGVAESVVQWQLANAARLEEEQDLLLLGGSACLSNLDSVLITEKTGLRTWNLGTFGFFYTDGHADILRFFIERVGPPRFLVYHTSHEAISTDRSKKEIRSWLGRLRQWVAPPEVMSYMIPSLRYRQELRDGILAMGRDKIGYTGLDQPRGNFGSDNEIRDILREQRGTGIGLRTRGEETVKGFPDQVVWGPVFDPDASDGLKIIFGMAEEYGFPVLIQFNPLPEQADNETVKAAMEKLQSNLEKVSRAYPGVLIYRPFIRFYPGELCRDMRHLSPEGAERNTRELIEWIRRHWLDDSE